MILLLSSGLVIGFSVFMAVLACGFILLVIWSASGKTKEVETFDNSLCDGAKKPTVSAIFLVRDTPENNEKTFDELKAELASFNEFDIEFMKDTASPRYSDHPVWIKAFDLYNRSNKPVSRLCSPCYFKVLQYIIHLKNSENEKTNQKNDSEKGGQGGC